MAHELIIHAGMHKTGPTSIQDALEGYDDTRTRYIDLGLMNHSIPILTLFSRGMARRHHQIQGRGPEEVAIKAEEWRSALKREFELDRTRKIISGEEISNLTTEEFADFISFAGGYFDRIRIIAYLRPPFGYMASSFGNIILYLATVIRYVFRRQAGARE